MTSVQAHQQAIRRSRRKGFTVFVVREEQPDGSMYDSASIEELETHYNGISDGNILAAYEDGERTD